MMLGIKTREEELEEQIASYKERLEKERDALMVKEHALICMDTDLSEVCKAKNIVEINIVIIANLCTYSTGPF